MRQVVRALPEREAVACSGTGAAGGEPRRRAYRYGGLLVPPADRPDRREDRRPLRMCHRGRQDRQRACPDSRFTAAPACLHASGVDVPASAARPPPTSRSPARCMRWCRPRPPGHGSGRRTPPHSPPSAVGARRRARRRPRRRVSPAARRRVAARVRSGIGGPRPVRRGDRAPRGPGGRDGGDGNRARGRLVTVHRRSARHAPARDRSVVTQLPDVVRAFALGSARAVRPWFCNM